jgi:hypothetical protein
MVLSQPPLHAQWTTDPSQNAPVSIGNPYAQEPVIVSDGHGGAFIAWDDLRAGSTDNLVFVQHLNASGVAQWTTGGVSVSMTGGGQFDPQILADDSGGVFVIWEDHRDTVNGLSNLLGQRVSSSGQLLWGPTGANFTNNGLLDLATTLYIKICSDGAGGILATWVQGFAQAVNVARITSAGTVSWWEATAGPINSTMPVISLSVRGGCIVAYEYEDLTTFEFHIGAQRLDGSGNILWDSGAVVCNAPASTAGQNNPAIVPDGAGGAVIGWEDFRNGNIYQAYAQRIDTNGARKWIAAGDSNGIALCHNSQDQEDIVITTDGTGGAIATWNDGSQDVYAQRINGSGALQWNDTSGLHVTNLPGVESFPTLVSDGSNGAILAWEDTRHTGANYDIYAQHVTQSGTMTWTANGVPVCTAPHEQTLPTGTADGRGGAIFTWYDGRAGVTNDDDIYAQRVSPSGDLTGVKTNPKALPAVFALNQNYPNPFNPTTEIRFTVDRAEHASIIVYDVLGREVTTLFDGQAEPGRSYSLQFDGSKYSSGIYFYRLTAPSGISEKKMLLVK